MSKPYFLRVAYVGTAFHGWQIQTSLRSVQAELWRALRAVEPDAPMPQGTGRTDAGVHARAQGVRVMVTREWVPYRLLAALNAHLPKDVRVLAAQPAPDGFWPRQHAVAKRYVYRLHQGPAGDPFLEGRSWYVHGAEPLSLALMQEGARCLLGEHDFSAFRHRECAAKTPIRQIYRADLLESGSQVELVFEGNRFLMHQVRIMAGTLVEVGKGRRPPASVAAALASGERSQAGITAPPHGLCLEEVWYQAAWGMGFPCPWGEPPQRD